MITHNVLRFGHFMAFNLDDYEPVAARLARWLNNGDHGVKRVLTYLEHYNETRCVFRAELWVDATLMATGWAEETRGEGHVNRTSHFENCETSAVGRALANAGLAGSDHTKRPSREEMEKVDRVLATVVDMNHSSATTKQMNYLKMLLDRHSASKEEQAAFIETTLGKAVSVSKLTAPEASALIKALQ